MHFIPLNFHKSIILEFQNSVLYFCFILLIHIKKNYWYIDKYGFIEINVNYKFKSKIPMTTFIEKLSFEFSSYTKSVLKRMYIVAICVINLSKMSHKIVYFYTREDKAGNSTIYKYEFIEIDLVYKIKSKISTTAFIESFHLNFHEEWIKKVFILIRTWRWKFRILHFIFPSHR